MKELKVLSIRNFIDKVKNNHFYVYLLLILILNIVSLNFPLVKDFSFEYSALNSVYLFLIGGIFFLNTKLKKLKDILVQSSLLLSLPLIVMFVYIIINGTCSFSDGILFYLLLVLPSLFMVIVLAYYTIQITSSKIRYLVYLLLVMAVASTSLIDIYRFPQIYFYNPLIGFFPGTIYDEGFRPSINLLLFRLYNIAVFGILLVALLKVKSVTKVKKVSTLILCFLFLITSWLISPTLNFTTSRDKLKEVMPVKIETEHFNIIVSGSLNNDEIKYIKSLHEFYYDQLKNFFKTELNYKITSYIFHDAAEKGKYFGAENADVAKPWLYEVYLDKDSYEQTLKHELAHCFTAAFAKGPLKLSDNFNSVLLEGTAAAADPFFRNKPVDYLASLAFNNNYKVNIVNLFKGFNFFKQNSALSYIYAGSFIKFLIEKYGVEKLKLLYSDLDFEKFYDKDLAQLQSEYFNYISDSTMADKKNEADFLFGRKTIFNKECPRYVAVEINNASQLYAEKRYEESLNKFYDLSNLSEDYYVVSGISASLSALNKNTEAVNYLSNKIYKFKNTTYYYYLLIKLGDLLVKNNDFKAAYECYNSVDKSNADNNISLAAGFRSLLLRNNILKEYLSGEDSLRLSLLNKLNKKGLYLETIPSILTINENLQNVYNSYRGIFNINFKIENKNDLTACLHFAETALKNLDYKFAQKAIKACIDYKKSNKIEMAYEEELAIKINWFQSNYNKY